jgi:hypothetical protein
MPWTRPQFGRQQNFKIFLKKIYIYIYFRKKMYFGHYNKKLVKLKMIETCDTNITNVYFTNITNV